ncbi:MAG: pantothenate kinase [Thermosynechococcaceae cyanobacterium]
MNRTVPKSPTWMALCIGNSRLHWALWTDDQLQHTWHTPHLKQPFQVFSQELFEAGQDSPAFQAVSQLDYDSCPELWLASVVPAQDKLWEAYPHLTVVTFADIPIPDLYPTLGIDRAIALWGAGVHYGWPVLVLDGGTALTLTGADGEGRFVGGAILPGLQLQARSLHGETAQLPLIEWPECLPNPWAKDTVTALQSGILYTAIAGLATTLGQWCQAYPNSPIILTGGDGAVLANYLRQWQQQNPSRLPGYPLQTDPYLIFRGLESLRQRRRGETP